MSPVKHVLCFSYSLICYGAGVISLVYFIFFVSDLFLSNTVNTTGGPHSIVLLAVVNVFAISLFGLQHSVMARASFKAWLHRFILPSIERSTYILFTAFAIFAMCHLWIPFGPVIWQAESDLWVAIIRAVALFGWCFLLLATFLINHFELFGLSQTFNPMLGRAPAERAFKTIGFYKVVRHPIQTGILIGMWAVPVSTLSHILFSSGITLYILIGLYFEERDLVREFGSTYQDYMRRVKRLIPFVA